MDGEHIRRNGNEKKDNFNNAKYCYCYYRNSTASN